jgi:hypothetical protein
MQRKLFFSVLHPNGRAGVSTPQEAGIGRRQTASI